MSLLEVQKHRSRIIIRDIHIQRESGSTVCRCNIGSDEEKILWYEYPSEIKLDVEQAYYAFTLAAIAIGMQHGMDVHVEAELDSVFLANVREYIYVWSAWRPNDFSRIELSVLAERHSSLSLSTAKGVMCFSGGVDGCATLRANIDDERFRARYPVKAGVLIQGFDVPLSSTDRFSWLAESCQRILASEELLLYTVRTNWRELIPNWRYTHGLALASCLWLFSREFNCGIIASGDDSYNNLIHGSNPFTDRLLSGGTFDVVSHGGNMTRVEKIERIYQWPAAMENLNVCWANRKGFGNCGRCEKCVRTKLYFYLLGGNPPECLPTQNIASEIGSVPRLDDLRLRIWRSILDLAKQKGKCREAWFHAASVKIKQSQKRNLFESYLKRIKSRISL